MKISEEGVLPLWWWDHAPNFGDLLSPWLVAQLTGHKAVRGDRTAQAHGLAIGSIVAYASRYSTVWGSGAFGTETKGNLDPDADYRAVRGPLTRNILRINGIDCPPVYGDPALLVPMFVRMRPEVSHEVGVCVRWNEKRWHEIEEPPGVKLINFGSTNVEAILNDLLACERVVTSSLHGLILADAFGIPSAWLRSNSPTGLEFKFYDYFLSVGKLRKPQAFHLNRPDLSVRALRRLTFDDRQIDFSADELLAASPWSSADAERTLDWPAPPGSSP